MANKKHRGTPAELMKQKIRTYQNQARKYAKLLEAEPNSIHRIYWQRKYDFYSKPPTK